MTEQKTGMVFCAECENLALAKLDSKPYCTSCLLSQIKQSHGRMMKRCVQPLFDSYSDKWRDRWSDWSVVDSSAVHMT